LDAGAGGDDRPAGGESRGGRWANAASYDREVSGSTQFLSRDPLVNLTKQPYSYALDNPLNGTDPTGLTVYPPGWSEMSTLEQAQWLAGMLPQKEAELKADTQNLYANNPWGESTGTGPGQYRTSYGGHIEQIRNMANGLRNRVNALRRVGQCPGELSEAADSWGSWDPASVRALPPRLEVPPEVPPEAAPAEGGGEIPFVPGNFGGGGHDDDL
jgi:hypothetical protein